MDKRDRTASRRARRRRAARERGALLALPPLLLTAALFFARPGAGAAPTLLPDPPAAAPGQIASAAPPATEPPPAQDPSPAGDPPPAGDTPDRAEEDWRLVLVNPWNPLPESRDVVLTTLKNGQSVDERCYAPLQEMMDDCRAAGLSPVICSSYRTRETQERLYRRQVEKLLARGLSQAEAEAEAGKAVAVPGTSEHQLGLAVDIVDLGNQNLDESQEETPVQRWLMENSWRYGFILRYPSGKSDLTGIIYEPWHYRYVGPEAAEEIHGQGLCLEEYLEGAGG